MGIASFNWLATIVAAALAFGFGFVWRRATEKPWMTASGYAGRPAIKARPLAIVFLAYLVIAGMLGGLVAHMGAVDLYGTFVTGMLIWAGFVLTAIVVDHSYEARSRTLTWLNAGHWLGVFLIMSVVIGLFG